MTRREREITDKNKLEQILNNCLYLHLGLVDDGKPYVVPMNYGVSKDESDGHYIIYLHSGHTGRKLDIIKKNPECCFTMELYAEPFEGKMACQYGMTYECLMGTGKITFVDEPVEKDLGLRVIMKTQTGRDDFAFDEKMTSIVTVMRIDVEELTGKHRPLPGEH